MQGQQRAVNTNVLSQISNISTILEEELIRSGKQPLRRPIADQTGKPTLGDSGPLKNGASIPKKGLGLAMAVGWSNPAE